MIFRSNRYHLDANNTHSLRIARQTPWSIALHSHLSLYNKNKIFSVVRCSLFSVWYIDAKFWGFWKWLRRTKRCAIRKSYMPYAILLSQKISTEISYSEMYCWKCGIKLTCISNIVDMSVDCHDVSASFHKDYICRISNGFVHCENCWINSFMGECCHECMKTSIWYRYVCWNFENMFNVQRSAWLGGRDSDLFVENDDCFVLYSLHFNIDKELLIENGNGKWEEQAEIKEQQCSCQIVDVLPNYFQILWKLRFPWNWK